MKSLAQLQPSGKALVLSLALALTFRATASFLGLPEILNFVFFPVLVLGLLDSRSGGTRTEARITRAFLVFSLALIASAAVNFADPLATAILWASLSTPFLLVLLALRQWSRPTTNLGLDRVLLVFLFVQAGVITVERFVLGRSGDAAQGFLRGQGAGHHVVGLIGVGTALYLALLLIEERERRRQLFMYAAVVAGVSMGVFTATMQGLLALAVTGVVFVLTKRSRWTLVAPAALTAVILTVIFSSWAALTPQERSWYGSDYAEYKGRAISAIVEEYRSLPHQVFFGLGPAQTTTRVAWLGTRESNLVASFGLRSGAVAQQLQNIEEVKPLWRSSSLTSPWSTWIGVWGDLGLFGLLAYAWVWVAIAKACVDTSTNRRAGLYVVLYLAMLGSFYNWLEEPILTLFVGLAIADAVVRSAGSAMSDELPGASSSSSRPLPR